MTRFMKKALACVLAAALLLIPAMPAAAADEKVPGTLNVNGLGTVKADPDMATFNLSVEVTNADTAAAQKEVAEKIEKLTAELKKLGVKEADIRTQYYNVYEYYEPYYGYDYSVTMNTIETTEPPEQPKTQYTVNHTLLVTVYDIDKVGEILDMAVLNGVTNIYGANYSIADPESFYIAALELAYKNAVKKAEAMAKLINVKLGDPISFMETSNMYVYAVYMDSGIYGGVSYAKDSSAGRTSLQPGQVEITAYITLTYQY